MRAYLLASVMAVVVAGCGDMTTESPGDLAAPDAAVAPVDQSVVIDHAAPPDQTLPPPDFATPQDIPPPPPQDSAGPPDLVAQPDLPKQPSTCKLDVDCRLFSSYCSTAPCMCLAIPAKDPDPPCNGNMVNCFADPCANKKAGCDAILGTCIVR